MQRVMALTATLLALAGGAQAQTQVPDPLPDLKILERPTRPERAPPVRLFISPSGEPFRGDDGLGAWLSAADPDHDGAVTSAEFKADALRFFAVLDADHNGVLDAFEIQAYERERVPEIANTPPEEGLRGRGPGRGRRGDPGDDAQASKAAAGPRAGPVGAARYSLLNEPQPVAAADEDVDGKVTLAEWTRAASRRFVRLDKTGTGRLTRESLLTPARPAKR